MHQEIQSLQCNHEDHCVILIAHEKAEDGTVIPVLKTPKQQDPWGLLASYSSWVIEIEVHWEILSQQNKMERLGDK